MNKSETPTNRHPTLVERLNRMIGGRLITGTQEFADYRVLKQVLAALDQEENR